MSHGELQGSFTVILRFLIFNRLALEHTVPARNFSVCAEISSATEFPVTPRYNTAAV